MEGKILKTRKISKTNSKNQSLKKSGSRKTILLHNLWKESVLNQFSGGKRLYEYRLRSAYFAILTIAGYHLPVEVLCDADDPGDGIHLELTLTVTVHHLVVDPPVLTLHRKHAVKLHKNSEPVWTFITVHILHRTNYLREKSKPFKFIWRSNSLQVTNITNLKKFL